MSDPQLTELIAETTRTHEADSSGVLRHHQWHTEQAQHLQQQLSKHGYSIVRTTNPMGKCQDKFPLSDPALLCQRDSGHAGGHEALDASCDRFRWPNLAAAAAEEDQ